MLAWYKQQRYKAQQHMNKHIIVTSFTLVLTMMVVLAVGKTDGAAELNVPDSIPGPGPDTENNVDEQILIRNISVPVQNGSSAVIQPEINDGDMILSLEVPEGHQADDRPLSPIMESLARVQEALKTLEQVAKSTEKIVVALEERKAAQ